jgi:hypothetical protein
MVTASMISYLSRTTYNTNTPLALVRACLKQCTYEFKQKATPGLTSVQYQDGSISKYQATEFLEEVEQVLKRYRFIALYETTTVVS